MGRPNHPEFEELGARGETAHVSSASIPDRETVPAILSWWSSTARDLPWRSTRDPWLILVSEIMAQQTQVERVVPKWTAFVKRFPTPEAAAAVPAGDLISMWDGLGYNRRALMLHACAVQICESHCGVVPDQLEQLLALPGIGPYTARAVLVFAFERDEAVLDTNVGRVLARLNGRSLEAKDAQRVADQLVPSGRGWEWNQALLDFGASVCQKRTPQCDHCVVRSWCAWRGDGPDPASGSAAVSVGQSAFEGSDRQGRGRLVSRLRGGAVPRSSAATVMGFDGDEERAERVLATLLRDGLVEEQGAELRLP